MHKKNTGLYYAVICLILLKCGMAAAAYGQFSSLVSQTPGSYKGGIIKFDQTDAISNLDISPSKEKIIIKVPGTYYMTAVGAVGAMVIGGKGYMDFWFIKNQTPMPNSNTRAAITDYEGVATITSSFIVNLVAGDEISIGFSASSPSLGLVFFQPDNETAMPSISLSIFTLN